MQTEEIKQEVIKTEDSEQEQIAAILEEAKYVPAKDADGNIIPLSKREIKEIAKNTFANNILAVHDEWGLTFSQIATICKCTRYAVFKWRKDKSCHAQIARLSLLAKYIDRPLQYFFYDNGIHKNPEEWPVPTIRIPPEDVLDFRNDITADEQSFLKKPYLKTDPKVLVDQEMKLFSNLPKSSQEIILHLTKLEHTHCQKKRLLVSQRMK